MKMADLLIGFYQGKLSDTAGRMIRDIWRWDHHKLEWTHDYIQWLFPLKEQSRFNPDAPVLNAGRVYLFRRYLRQQVLRSLRLMLGFYGLRCIEKSGESVTIEKGDNFKDRSLFWITEGNHNYLRISRILRSLVIVGLEDCALAFFDCLRKIYQEEREEIGEGTLGYWKAATARKPNRIKQMFDEHFGNWGIQLPDPEMNPYLKGLFRMPGQWVISYQFGEEKGVWYLEYYFRHLIASDSLHRIYENGEVITISEGTAPDFYEIVKEKDLWAIV